MLPAPTTSSDPPGCRPTTRSARSNSSPLVGLPVRLAPQAPRCRNREVAALTRPPAGTRERRPHLPEDLRLAEHDGMEPGGHLRQPLDRRAALPARLGVAAAIAHFVEYLDALAAGDHRRALAV